MLRHHGLPIVLTFLLTATCANPSAHGWLVAPTNVVKMRYNPMSDIRNSDQGYCRRGVAESSEGKLPLAPTPRFPFLSQRYPPSLLPTRSRPAQRGASEELAQLPWMTNGRASAEYLNNGPALSSSMIRHTYLYNAEQPPQLLHLSLLSSLHRPPGSSFVTAHSPSSELQPSRRCSVLYPLELGTPPPS
ncbi:uncharacterized protein EI97DRAFT_209233 [Westerdykella ornata]|uniref:Uncharacterized protein n=1 Tax=Westerdykella ornata TaxID=318751 RepID=A0A6A6J7Q1_WESOR|nr:uncharacterized protein EI97DRAFT_209233 [Westerdykella ornata]KAF2272425.1 hypothetical protein EI97DRAFT_209233 [Westerdykella ornata]